MKAALYFCSALLAVNVPLAFIHPTPPWVTAVLFACCAIHALVEAARA